MEGLIESGLLERQAASRLDSTFVLGLVSHIRRFECGRKTFRLAFRGLQAQERDPVRPALQSVRWERYVENMFSPFPEQG